MNADSIDQKVIEVLEESSNTSSKKDNTITLSSGVVLKNRKVPPMILAKVEEKYPDPPVPTVYDSERDRYLPNPDSPEYEKALEDNRMRKGNSLIDVLISMGTEIVSIPEGLQKPDDSEWVDDLLSIGIEVPSQNRARYLAWVKFYAATSASDIQELAKRGSESLGVTESEVASAIAVFQDQQERKTNSNGSVEVSSGD